MRIVPATLIGLSLVLGGCQSDKKPNENEAKLRLDEVPPVVREALRREADGQPIDTIDRFEKNGTVIYYEIDVPSEGKTWEVRVDPQGRLLSRRSEKGNRDRD